MNDRNRQRRTWNGMALQTFLALPLCAMIVMACGQQDPFRDSLSRMAWIEGKFLPVLIWGALNIVSFCYSIYAAAKEGAYDRGTVRRLLRVTVASAASLSIGISIPAIPENLVPWIMHGVTCATGFIGFFAVLVDFTLTLRDRNRRQYHFSQGMLLFILITGSYVIMATRGSTNHCLISAVAETWLALCFNMMACLEYALMCRFSPDENGKERE